MLGLVISFFIGLSFFNLAVKHKKPEFEIIALGIISVVGTVLLLAFIVSFVSELIDSKTQLRYSILCLYVSPFGLFVWLNLYAKLNRKWSKGLKEINQDVLDDELYED